ncbi:hypothetical protein LCGC14_2454420, partial [marine sediment metagenome]
ENIIARVTIQALAAVLGGTQSLHTNSKDEALALPSDSSAITALRTQQIIAHESGVVNSVDPLGGSYYLEWLTEELEKQSWELIREIEKIGLIDAISNGIIQNKIHDSAYQHERMLEKKERIIVGVNKFKQDKYTIPDLLKIDDEIALQQINRLNDVRKSRDQVRVDEILDKLTKAAKNDENLFPIVLNAVLARATLGEITNSLIIVFSRYKPTFTI